MATLTSTIGRVVLLLVLTGTITTTVSTGLAQGQRPGQSDRGNRDRPPAPSESALEACAAKQAGEACSATGPAGRTFNGSCFTPRPERAPACRPKNRPREAPPQGAEGTDTSAVLCDLTRSATSLPSNLQGRASWRCTNADRVLSANGLPDHEIGTFPNPGNPNAPRAQPVEFSASLNPALQAGPGQPVKHPGYALNGIAFDPATAGTCDSATTNPASCALGRGSDEWQIEALGQRTFNFGVDANHGHVQPTGKYHYHGIPEGMLSAEARAGQVMTLIGWAADGFPIYARFGHQRANEAKSPLKAMVSSYRLKAQPDPKRPSVDVIPMGAFTQDFEYLDGLGDLDECNGRAGVTPEFPNGIYHYYVTDTYPFVQRCLRGESRRAGRNRRAS